MPFVAKYFSLVFLLHYLVCKWSLFDMQWVFCRLPNTSIIGYDSNYKDIFEYIDIHDILKGKYSINHHIQIFPNHIIFLCFGSKYLPCHYRPRKGIMTQYWWYFFLVFRKFYIFLIFSAINCEKNVIPFFRHQILDMKKLLVNVILKIGKLCQQHYLSLLVVVRKNPPFNCYKQIYYTTLIFSY